jgi:citrate lyase subunit beta/citryl-CoA lyase
MRSLARLAVRLRSLLFVPGDRPDQMQKALSSGADALILDLEDAVSLAHKADARTHVRDFLRRGPPLPVMVRINALSTGFSALDLGSLATTRPAAILLPKSEGAASVHELDELLVAAGLDGLGVLPIATETPLAVFRLGEYPAVRARLVGLTWGAEDLPAAIGASESRRPDGGFTPPYEMVRALTLFAAHAAAVPALETVFPNFRDTAGLTAYAERAAHDGFTGMLAIHPSQVAVINAAFTPAPAALERARRLVAAFAAQPGAGVINLDGAMFDAPHLVQAQRLIARADAASPSPASPA